MSRRWVAALAALGAVGALLLAVRGKREAPLPLLTLGGVARPESCLLCHQAVEGLGAAHDPAKIGCSTCHLGDPSARGLESAHAGMVVLTGDLASVSSTCGRAECHASEAARVSTSLMAGSPGILAVNRFAFGERATVEVRREDDLRSLGKQAKSPAEDHARKLCGSCHLAAPKERRGDLGFDARGGGCTACHLTAPSAPLTGTGPLHPGVGADVPERRCEGCHARSGRISLSFRGIAEVEPGRATRKLPDGRPATDAPADVHARAGMTCIDCHTERDVMGDGRDLPRHARDAVESSCTACHEAKLGSSPPDADRTRVVEVLERAWQARGMPSLSGRAPLTLPTGTPLWRTDRTTRTLLLATTGASKPLVELRAARYHTLRGHERLECQACHSEWAPRCGSCHTSLDAAGSDLDHLTGELTPGKWTETAGDNSFGPPALALGSTGRIGPFVEGMKLRITGVSPEVSRTLYAPIDPHTTGKARACASCHPGSESTYPLTGQTTRQGARLLDAAERGRIARVGRCLECHEGYDDRVWEDFAKSRERLATRSRAPASDVVRRCRGTLAE